MNEENLISAMEYGAYIKKALSIAVNVGCGFEGDAEDAAKLLSLITFHESRIAELEGLVRELLAEGEYLSMLNGLVDNDSDWKQLVDKANKTLPEVQE